MRADGNQSGKAKSPAAKAESLGAQAPSPAPVARGGPSAYRRNLPHMQREGRTYWVTFTTKQRWVLPAAARSVVLQHVLHDHGKTYELHAAVVMPDHVHLLFSPLSA